jgi:hypothetical protein
MSDKHTDTPAKASGAHTAGAFDIRNIIGALLSIYGVLLLAAGLFMDAQEAKTGGVNANLWTGLALAVAGALFLLWARLKPIVVPADVEPVADAPTRPAPRRRPGGH